jgi:hypothetical protein
MFPGLVRSTVTMALAALVVIGVASCQNDSNAPATGPLQISALERFHQNANVLTCIASR